MFTLTTTRELPFGVSHLDALCDECSQPESEHCSECEECPLTDGACWCTAETFTDGEPTPNAAAPAKFQGADPGHTLKEIRNMTRGPKSAPVLDANGDPVTVAANVVANDAFRAFMAGRVPASECPHYIAASEAGAGFTRCERC